MSVTLQTKGWAWVAESCPLSLCLSLTPWDNRNGWLGVKHQITNYFLSVCLSVCLSLSLSGSHTFDRGICKQHLFNCCWIKKKIHNAVTSCNFSHYKLQLFQSVKCILSHFDIQVLTKQHLQQVFSTPLQDPNQLDTDFITGPDGHQFSTIKEMLSDQITAGQLFFQS